MRGIIQNYLQSKNVDFVIKNGHFVCTCFFCGKEDHFYINHTTGLWDCKRCGETGNFYQLQFKNGDIVDKDVKPLDKTLIEKFKITKDSDGYKYLLDRCLSESTIDYFNLVYIENRRVIGFVYKDLYHKPYTIKCRKINEKEFFYYPSNIDILYPYNAERINTFNRDYIIICEGEIDCLSLYEYGYKNVIALAGANVFKKKWVELFKDFKTIYLCLDMDSAGESGVETIKELLMYYNLKRVYLPYKDVNDCLKAGITKEEFSYFIKSAKEIESNLVIQASSAEITPINNENIGYSTGYKTIDEFIRWRKTELTIFTAETKHGKTTFLLNLAYKQLIDNNPVLIGSFEMGIKRTNEKLASIIMQKSIKEFTESDLQLCNKYLNSIPLYYINNYGQTEFSKVVEAIKYCYYRYNVRFILLDHLHFFLSAKDISSQVSEIGTIMRNLKKLALDLELVIWLIVQPRATSGEITYNDLRGSGELKQIADNVIVLDANKKNNTLKLHIDIVRYELFQTGTVELKFNNKTQTFID